MTNRMKIRRAQAAEFVEEIDVPNLPRLLGLDAICQTPGCGHVEWFAMKPDVEFSRVDAANNFQREAKAPV